MTSAATIRCAQWAAGLQLDPVGSAPVVGGFLLVSWPLPWPADVGDVAELAEVLDAARRVGFRVQLVTRPGADPVVVRYAPRATGATGATGAAGAAVMVPGEPGATFSEFERLAVAADDPASLVAVASDLLAGVGCLPTGAGDSGAGTGDLRARGVTADERAPAGHQPSGAGDLSVGSSGLGSRRAPRAGLLGAPAQAGTAGDVLVCTHGRRDRCCGSAGMALFQELAERHLPARWELSRTSHTGGHRFAPTAVVLPEGTMWAFADPDLLEQVVTRSGSFSEVAARYRGCAGLDSAASQVLERVALEEEGWSVLDGARQGTALGGGRHRLTVRWPDGRVRVWEATVVPRRRLPLPECGAPAGDRRRDAKPVTELAATDVDREDATPVRR